jgi:hypothetical protein
MDNRLRVVRWVIFGEVAFLFFMGVSVTLHPGFVLAKHEGGISEYGLHIKTAVLYTLAWALLAGSNMRAARTCARGCALSKKVRRVLLAYSALIFLVLVSTYFYSINAVLKYIHFGFGAVLIVFMSWAAYWLCQKLPGSTLAKTLLAAQLLGSVAALASIVGAIHILFFAETLSNVGCAILLAMVCSKALGENAAVPAVLVVA